ncbi:lipid A 3-O-deacylase [Nitrospira sp.]|nr:lipid A 3-O-deacylase [Nitrospira sp.]
MISRVGWFTLLTCFLLSVIPSRPQADSTFPGIRLGTQEVGLSLGPMLPWRVKPSQSTKLFGVEVLPSWSITLTDSVGTGWYEGQFRLGAELVLLYTYEPVTSGSVGLTPKLAYTFTALGRWRPFLEGGGGPVWTELGGQVPEQPAAFNFIVMGGGGLSYLVSPQLALTIGGRFYHISNGGTRSTNRGLNFGFPYLGFSWYLF